MTKAGGRFQVSAAFVWTLAMDTFAKASAVATAATGEEELRQRTPAHCAAQAPVGNQWLPGSLPDGDPVAGAVGAYSAAVGPIVAGGAAWGAITIIRSAARPCVRFIELSFLSHIADLAGIAAKRLRCG